MHIFTGSGFITLENLSACAGGGVGEEAERGLIKGQIREEQSSRQEIT